MADYILAIDQGTTSTRSIIFDKKGSIVASGQLEHEQIFPKAGWVEHDPMEIWHNTREVIGQALGKADLTRHDIAAVGITNQRETAVVWDKNTGEPVYNAIVWQDTRTQPIVDRLAADGGVERFKQDVGLPLATYFSGTKIVWILENVEGAREKAEAGDLLFGTTDTLGALEPHRRRRRRRARDGCHERQPHDVHGPRDPQLARRHPRRVRRAESMMPDDQSRPPRSTATSSRRACCARCRSPASSATSRPRPSARRRSTPASRRTPTAPATS